ncbi:MAG: hypothetical protein ACRD5H_08295, partial [Nitrososphaerales archaeon]
PDVTPLLLVDTPTDCEVSSGSSLSAACTEDNECAVTSNREYGYQDIVLFLHKEPITSHNIMIFMLSYLSTYVTSISIVLPHFLFSGLTIKHHQHKTGKTNELRNYEQPKTPFRRSIVIGQTSDRSSDETSKQSDQD